jgi:1,4-alpha-glucan branching enzyme
VAFLQNHDQIGNRALGERIQELVDDRALRAATELLLLNPMPPLLFMGQEWCASSPFPFFCDFDEELAEAVRRGRLEEFARFEAFSDPAARARIPDPVSATTFETARLCWDERLVGEHGEWWRLCHDLLALRRLHLVPLLAQPPTAPAEHQLSDERALQVRWHLAGGARYTLQANLGQEPRAMPQPAGQRIYATPGVGSQTGEPLPGWSTVFVLEREGDGDGAAS